MNKVRYCNGCGVLMTLRHKIKFCSNKCQVGYQHNKWVESWKHGKVHGNIGITARNISTHLRKYLIGKYGNKKGDNKSNCDGN